LVDYAWTHLILLPPVSAKGKRGERKKLLLELIAKGRVTDFNKLLIAQLRDYIRVNRLSDPGLGAKKKQLATIVENSFHLPEKVNIRETKEQDIETMNDDLLNLLLLDLRPSLIYRLYLLSSRVRFITEKNKELFWRQKLRISGFLEPLADLVLTKEFNWKKWYLEVTDHPIPGDVYAKGDNSYGQLGFTSRKSHINEATLVPMDGVISLDSKTYPHLSSGFTVFIDANHNAYSCGHMQTSYFDFKKESNGWNINDENLEALLKKRQATPAQRMFGIGKVSHVRIAGNYVFSWNREQEPFIII
jgi:hypothetical protein